MAYLGRRLGAVGCEREASGVRAFRHETEERPALRKRASRRQIPDSALLRPDYSNAPDGRRRQPTRAKTPSIIAPNRVSTNETTSPDSGELAGLLSAEFVRLVKKSTGRGPAKAYTILGRDYLVTFFRDTMTDTEQTLTERGEGGFASEIREMIHATMRPDVEVLVERLTGRKVVAVLADHSAEPDVGLLACVLEPESPDPTPPAA